MATKKATETFTPEEKAAMRARAKEQKANASKEAALKEVLAAYKKMTPADREIGEKLHALVKKVAPQLWAKTWYGMPAFANDEGKAILYTGMESDMKKTLMMAMGCLMFSGAPLLAGRARRVFDAVRAAVRGGTADARASVGVRRRVGTRNIQYTSMQSPGT
jgi:hypothetical protein